MSIQMISFRYCSSFLKNCNIIHRTCHSKYSFHKCCSPHRTVLSKQIKFDHIVLYRQISTNNMQNKNIMMYALAGGIFMLGMSYAAVPLYRLFCQSTGRGGTATHGDVEKVERLEIIKEKKININFVAETASAMRWKFQPLQHTVQVYPGETALAFYKATNPTDHPIIGISTYNIVPFEAGQYFNKIQCFCFEEQRLNAKEENWWRPLKLAQWNYIYPIGHQRCIGTSRVTS